MNSTMHRRRLATAAADRPAAEAGDHARLRVTVRVLIQAALLLFLFGMVNEPASAASETEPALLWALKGKTNTVYFLGSIHGLRSADVGLSSSVEAAFQDAERLYMEIDMDEPGIAEMDSHARAMHETARLPAGRSLRTVLGADYTEIARKASEQGLNLALFDEFAPWYVALLLVQQSLVKLGFEPGLGIEQRLVTRAVEAQKPIEGLETPAEQFAVFSRLTPAQQRDFLRASLDNLVDVERDAGGIVAAWHEGDVAELTDLLDRERKRAPEIYGSLIVERNRAWLADIEALLDDTDDYLVVVGAMHLVGPQSLVDLLRERGHRVERR